MMPRKDEELQRTSRDLQKTLEVMGDLPCHEYHFLNQILPTDIIMELNVEFNSNNDWAIRSTYEERYVDFLGVSCKAIPYLEC